MSTQYTSNSGSYGKDLFLRLFSDTFRAEKAEILKTCDEALERYFSRDLK